MFWRFGFHTVSPIDTLLEKDDLAVEELMDQDDILQELRAANSKLIDFLCQPEVLSQLFGYLTCTIEDNEVNMKYPYIAGEILSCEEVWGLSKAILENKELLSSFWEILDKPAPLPSIQAAYFSKIICTLLVKKSEEMVLFIREQPDAIDKFLSHLETPAIMDIVLKLISLDELPNGAGVVEWLSSEGLMSKLIDRLSPKCDTETYSVVAPMILDIITISKSTSNQQPNAGPNKLISQLKSKETVARLVNYMLDSTSANAASVLVNGVGIFIELIRRNYSDDEPAGLFQYTEPIVPIDLSDMLEVLSDRLGDFQQVLKCPRNVAESIESTVGKVKPLGFERLKVCELYAELLHCANINVPESESGDEAHKTTLGSDVRVNLKQKYVDLGIVTTCLDLFFEYPWNNFLHTIVYDILHQILNLPYEVDANKALILSVFNDADITSRITDAQKQCDIEINDTKNIRPGYMGHLTFIAEEVVRLIERSPEVAADVNDKVQAEPWKEYVSKTLREIKERDQQPLGGQRPNLLNGFNDTDDDDDDYEDEDDLDREQLARYLTPSGELRSQFVTSFDDDDESDDDDPDWLSKLAPADGSYTMNLENMEYDGDDQLHALPDATSEEDQSQRILTIADWSAEFQENFESPQGLGDDDESTSKANNRNSVEDSTSDQIEVAPLPETEKDSQ
ncbi:SAPS-domain-containing protein [Basidiobolus meristosporus CBS 931.73]|uniref:SAPS-domain-containing protein n=1 Tax=Basidiobolus meristosporus CBS 931.73 TaxID=1314790 RepID=A0A1Y1Y2K9_9FUNG|nr:SAPS-domain-containing protein [Basidiobolus meristosporus CBS 931.73]|eukprot:ORX92115.1 SAPS-domain-containing protein [Basidiobolus meristosporus CBS 931.73]